MLAIDSIRPALERLAAAVTLRGPQLSGEIKALALVGRAGTGKTAALSRAASELLPDLPVFHIYSSELVSAADEGAMLLGSAPGHGLRVGVLMEAVRARPSTMIVFHEPQELNQAAVHTIKQILDTGRLIDMDGSSVSFSKSLVAFESHASDFQQFLMSAHLENRVGEILHLG